jgi:hypothetical protein
MRAVSGRVLNSGVLDAVGTDGVDGLGAQAVINPQPSADTRIETTVMVVLRRGTTTLLDRPQATPRR